jgi:DNA-binding FrmR family transcriptional regulator
LLNFKKAQSFLAKMIKMVEEDHYCIDIMQQNLAVIGMLKSASGFNGKSFKHLF